MATRWVDNEGPVQAEFIVEDGVAHRRLTNTNAQAILRNNQEVRRGTVRKSDWAQAFADIPEADIPWLRTQFGPEFLNPMADKESRKRALTKFMISPLSDPYRLVERKRMGGL